MARATKLKQAGGKNASAKSKTGDPKCSQAMSDWVRGRKTGSVAPEVFSILAKCRQKASQNRKATLQQQSGKLAGAGGKTSVDTGRGTWQRSEQAAKLVAERRAKLASRGQSELQAKAAAMRESKPVDGPALRARADVAAGKKPATNIKTPRESRYERLGAKTPEIKGMLSEARATRVKEIRAERAAKAEQAPGKPSLREQAAAFRATKGTRGERLANVARKVIERRVKLEQPRTERTMTVGDRTINKVFLYRNRKSAVESQLTREPLSQAERNQLAGRLKEARNALRNPAPIVAKSESQRKFAEDTRASLISIHLPKPGASKSVKHQKTLEASELAKLGDSRKILDERGYLNDWAKRRREKATVLTSRADLPRPNRPLNVGTSSPAAAPKPAAVASTKPAKGTREERLARITQRREARFEKTFQDTFNRLDRKGYNQIMLADLRDSLGKRFNRQQFDKGLNKLRLEQKFSLDSYEGMNGPMSKRQIDAAIHESGSALVWASRNTASAERARTPRSSAASVPAVKSNVPATIKPPTLREQAAAHRKMKDQRVRYEGGLSAAVPEGGRAQTLLVKANKSLKKAVTNSRRNTKAAQNNPAAIARAERHIKRVNALSARVERLTAMVNTGGKWTTARPL